MYIVGGMAAYFESPIMSPVQKQNRESRVIDKLGWEESLVHGVRPSTSHSELLQCCLQGSESAEGGETSANAF